MLSRSVRSSRISCLRASSLISIGIFCLGDQRTAADPFVPTDLDSQQQVAVTVAKLVDHAIAAAADALALLEFLKRRLGSRW